MHSETVKPFTTDIMELVCVFKKQSQCLSPYLLSLTFYVIQRWQVSQVFF